VLYISNSLGWFGTKTIIGKGIPPITIASATADLNNNGLADIIWAHPFSFHLNTGIQLVQENNNEKLMVTTFPNPYYDHLLINAIEPSELSIFDVTGRCHYHNIRIEKGINTFSYHLPPQLYYFRFVTPAQIITEKIVKGR
jgi:hypothetical protein